MGFLGVVGILIGLVAFRFAFVDPSRLKIALLSLAYIVHLATTIFYYVGVQASAADTWLYYNDPFGHYEQGFGLSTQLILFLVQWTKENIGGSYFDFFLLFQATGFWGIAILMRILEEVTAELGIEERPFLYLLLFLPSIHYWTSAIGKDAPFFFATCLALWGAMRLRERYVRLAVGIALMLVIRPHIALLCLTALAATVIVARSVQLHVRIGLGFLGIAGVALAFSTVQATFQVDLSSAQSVSELLEARETIIETEDAGSTVVTGSYPVRMFSLLFRPLFFDTSGFVGYVASAENLLLLFLVALLIYRYKSLMLLSRKVLFLRFALFYSIFLVLMLTLTYYNVGLGSRQKSAMIMPVLLIIIMTTAAFAQARTRRSAAAAT